MKYFKVIADTDYFSSWKSKRLSTETIKPPSTSDNSLTLSLSYYGTKPRVQFTESCLKQSTISYNHRPITNIYIVYELGASSSHNNDPTLENCLFGAATLTKNALRCISTLVMKLSLIEDQAFHFVVAYLVKMH